MRIEIRNTTARRTIATTLATVVAAFVLAACSGSNSAVPRAAAPVAAPTSSAAGSVGALSVTITIPIPAKTTTSSAKRSPKYVSSSTQSATAVVTDSSGKRPAVTGNVQTTSGSSQIVLSVPASPGTDQFTLTLYDGANGTGNILSTGNVAGTIGINAANSLTIVNGGVVKTFTMSVASAIVPGTALSQALTYTALDADGNTIMGAFDEPVALGNSDTSGAFAVSTTTIPNSSTAVNLAYNGSTSVTQATITATTQSAASTANGSASLGSLTVAPAKPAPSSSPVFTGGSGAVCLQSSYAFTSAEIASLRATVNGVAVTQSLGLSGCTLSFTAPAGTGILVTLTLPTAGTPASATLTAATTRAFSSATVNVAAGGTTQVPLTIDCIVASFTASVPAGTFIYPATSATIPYTITALDGSGAAACTSGTYVNAAFTLGTFATTVSGGNGGLAVTTQAVPGTAGAITDNGTAASSGTIAVTFAGTTANATITYTTLAVGWAYERVGTGRTGSTPIVQGTNISFAVPGANTPAWNTMVSAVASGPIFDTSGNIWAQTGSGSFVLSGSGAVVSTNTSFLDTLFAFDHTGKLYTTTAASPTTVNVYATSGYTTSLLRTITAPGTVCSADADSVGNVYVGLCSTSTQAATVLDYPNNGTTVGTTALGYTNVIVDGVNDVFAFQTTSQGSASVVRWSAGTPISTTPTQLLASAAGASTSLTAYAVDARGDVCALTVTPNITQTFTSYDASGLGLNVCPATTEYGFIGFGSGVSDLRPAGQIR